MSDRAGLLLATAIALVGPVGVVVALLAMPALAHAVPLVCSDPVIEVTAEPVAEPPADATRYSDLPNYYGVDRALRMASQSGAYYRCQYTSDSYDISNGFQSLLTYSSVQRQQTLYYQRDRQWYRVEWSIDRR